MTAQIIPFRPRYRFDWLAIALWGFGPSVWLVVLFFAIWRWL